MTDVPVQVVVAAFKDEETADEVLAELRGAKSAGLIGIRETAVIRRDEKNKLHIKEPKDWGGGKGAVVGGLVVGPLSFGSKPTQRQQDTGPPENLQGFRSLCAGLLLGCLVLSQEHLI